jgi:hypothetical protein
MIGYNHAKHAITTTELKCFRLAMVTHEHHHLGVLSDRQLDAELDGDADLVHLRRRRDPEADRDR